MEFIEILDDDDLELPNPMKDFLGNKLKEIQLQNKEADATIQDLREKISKLQDASSKPSQTLTIEKSWIKIVGKEFILWFSINTSNLRILGHGNSWQFILNWNLTYPFLYRTKLFNTEKLEFCLENPTHFAVIFKVPDFLEKLQVKISGSLLYGPDSEKNKEISISIPEVLITPRDSTNREFLVPNYKLIEAKIPDFTSYLVSYTKTDFWKKIKCDLHRDFNSILEIDASLYPVEFGTKKYHISHKLSPNFDGTIVDISNKNILTIYHKDEESLLAFLHHLYQTVDALTLTLKTPECNSNAESVQKCEENLRNCIENEIKFAGDFKRKFCGGSEELKSYRLQFCDLELQTDQAYIQLKSLEETYETIDVPGIHNSRT